MKNLERRKSVQVQNPRIYQFFMNFLKYTSFEIPPAIFQLSFSSLLISILLAMLTLKCDSERCQKPRGGGGRLPNKGRYGYAASAKPRPGKISPNNPMPGQVFMIFRVSKKDWKFSASRFIFDQIFTILQNKRRRWLGAAPHRQFLNRKFYPNDLYIVRKGI